MIIRTNKIHQPTARARKNAWRHCKEILPQRWRHDVQSNPLHRQHWAWWIKSYHAPAQLKSLVLCTYKPNNIRFIRLVSSFFWLPCLLILSLTNLKSFQERSCIKDAHIIKLFLELHVLLKDCVCGRWSHKSATRSSWQRTGLTRTLWILSIWNYINILDGSTMLFHQWILFLIEWEWWNLSTRSTIKACFAVEQFAAFENFRTQWFRETKGLMMYGGEGNFSVHVYLFSHDDLWPDLPGCPSIPGSTQQLMKGKIVLLLYLWHLALKVYWPQ